MAIPTNPPYSPQVLDLRTAGAFVIAQSIGYVHLLRFMDGPNPETAQTLLIGYIGLSFGNADDAKIPLDYNTKISIPGKAPITRLSWPAQANTYALLLYTPDVSVFQMDAPPARQLVTTSGGTGLENGALVVGVAAAQLMPANSNRYSLILKNNSAGTVYIGKNAALTVANGFPLGPGDVATIDDTTAAVWAIGSAAALDVRYLEQVA